MSQQTKTRIQQAAMYLFKEQGYAATNLQDVAKASEMARRNVVYHFSDKTELLNAILEEMWTRLEMERAKTRAFPSFQNIQKEVEFYRKVKAEYDFIFSDIHLLRQPRIREKFEAMAAQSIKDNKASIAFAIKIGNMKPEPIPGIYFNLAKSVWVLSITWFSDLLSEDPKRYEKEEKMIWSMLLPHFTEKGIKAFKDFFGVDYFNSLGEPFDNELNKLSMF
ncbi:MAG: TetR/AcrR family transcriptional regulator [Bacteroidota bacterium]